MSVLQYHIVATHRDHFLRHIISYVRKLGGLKLIHALPKRKGPKKEISYTKYLVLVENLEELVDFFLQEITQPLDQLGPESPMDQVFLHSPPQYLP